MDAHGVRMAKGTLARILSIPDWLTHDLPVEEMARLKKMEGTVMPILEIDAYGMVWFGANDPWFCLKPKEVAAVESSPQNVV